MSHVGRRTLPHGFPFWVDPEQSYYFITICCEQRGPNQLCIEQVGKAILESARFYANQRKWYPFVFLLMPDHLHMLVSFGRECSLETVVTEWKRYVAKQYRISWQRGFFEHRLRAEESMQEKADYILQNPVRAGLIQNSPEWPYAFTMD
jgi:REP element-mobilizing transposase RayT